MYYVLLESDTVHRIETPKDHSTISKLSYQFINADTLECYYSKKENKTSVIGENEDGTKILFKDVLAELEKDVNEVIGNEELVLCSLNSTWDVRVTIRRQAHDEGITLPAFLENPRVFDLWNELQKWCTNHEDSMESKKSKTLRDVNELFRVLELEDISDDRKLEIDETANVFLTLHKKCSTPEDIELVLTHPYDSVADLYAFLEEASRVLYMNNLPPDTTQSELESWFAQFGARPVGFWTVKNIVEDTSNINNNWAMNNSPYVEEHDSISGFVVFQTHKEAFDALTLNGRSILSNMANTKQPRVVEHIVEIQPSSSSVLERVQEISSPFPQSKNKPRPGDWNCLSCGFSNFQRRTSCFRCSFPAASVTQNNIRKYNNSSNIGGMVPPNSQDSSMGLNRVNSIPTQYNYSVNFQHNQHEGGQQRSSPITPTSDYSGMAMGSNSQYRYVNNANSNNRFNNQQTPSNGNSSGSNVPFRAGDWKCVACTYHNFAKNVVCLRCGGPKAPAEIGSHNTTNPSNYNNGRVNQQYHNQFSNHSGTNNNNNAGLMELVNLKATILLDENSDKNSLATSGVDNTNTNNGEINGNGFDISLDTRSSSEPAW